MTRVRSSCDTCGEIDISSSSVSLHVCVNAPHLTTYAFTCPDCENLQTRSAPPLVAQLLRSIPVSTVMWRVPAEALEPHTGPVINLDDVLDFALADLDAAMRSFGGQS